MNIIVLTINLLIGIFLSKYFFISIIKKEYKKDIIVPSKLRNYFFYPLSSIFYKGEYKAKFILSEILGLSVFFIFLIGSLYNYENNRFSVFESTTHYIIYTLVLIPLLYLAIFDLITFSVPVSFTKTILFLSVIINILIAVVRYLVFRISGETIFMNINLGNIDNLLMYLILIVGTILMVKITNEKGIGEGDVDINGIAALMLGFPSSLMFVFSTLIVGSFVSIIYSVKIQKFRGVIIPLVPFILIGFTVAINFADLLISIILP